MRQCNVTVKEGELGSSEKRLNLDLVPVLWNQHFTPTEGLRVVNKLDHGGPPGNEHYHCLPASQGTPHEAQPGCHVCWSDISPHKMSLTIHLARTPQAVPARVPLNSRSIWAQSSDKAASCAYSPALIQAVTLMPEFQKRKLLCYCWCFFLLLYHIIVNVVFLGLKIQADSLPAPLLINVQMLPKQDELLFKNASCFRIALNGSMSSQNTKGTETSLW